LAEISYILKIIGQAIDHAHNLDLLHGHIDLGNILFTLEGIPVLVDFELIYLADPRDLQTFLQFAH
jgi:serine/threonine protein kinase